METMDTSINALSQEWSALLDELKQKESISSDAKLAAELGVTRGYICSVRKGRKGFSLRLAQAIFARLERTFDTESLERLFVPIRIQAHVRSLASVRSYVIQRANEHCQLCGCAAPFKDNQGRPYLEIHHILPFRERGSDSAENLVALCPNCHRRIEVTADTDDKKKLQKIAVKYKKHG
jgi:transcriptional regulator with XRE-family HTH domain